MKKFLTLTLLGATFLANPLYAADNAAQDDRQDIKADEGAIVKDNAAISHDSSGLAKDRAAKAQDKATESYGSQAVESVKIGVDKTAIGEKKLERDVDGKILTHHENNLDSDR